jgi:hypothetical protein
MQTLQSASWAILLLEDLFGMKKWNQKYRNFFILYPPPHSPLGPLWEMFKSIV